MENIPADIETYNAFYGAFVRAYNRHEAIVLSPDDVWMTVVMQFSKYVNTNHEKLRHMLVEHKEGQKKLVVRTEKDLDESQWGEFFTKMIAAINENTKNGVVSALQNKFTTTGDVETIISTATIMDSFKKFFSYGRLIPMCGITEARFLGTLEDWTSLPKKLAALSSYDVDGKWKKYIDNLTPVLNQFAATYQGQVDVNWWNKIMNITHGRLGSGSTSYISGWILAFFGLTGQVETCDIPDYKIDVPVVIDNKITGQMKTVNLVGGFGGIQHQNDAYRPQLSLAIIHPHTMKY